MGMLDGLLSQLAGTVDIQTLAAKIGLTPQQVGSAITALGIAHPQPGDTIATAADQTGIEPSKLQEIVNEIGGEGALEKFAGLLGGAGGEGGVLRGMFGKN